MEAGLWVFWRRAHLRHRRCVLRYDSCPVRKPTRALCNNNSVAQGSRLCLFEFRCDLRWYSFTAGSSGLSEPMDDKKTRDDSTYGNVSLRRGIMQEEVFRLANQNQNQVAQMGHFVLSGADHRLASICCPFFAFRRFFRYSSPFFLCLIG